MSLEDKCIMFCVPALQMHGYDLNGLPPGPQGPQQPLGGPMPDLMGHHPDSTDSYVTYQDSDDSMAASP